MESNSCPELLSQSATGDLPLRISVKEPAGEDAGVLLPLLHQECAGTLHLCVVSQPLSSRQDSPSEGRQHSLSPYCPHCPPRRTFSALLASVQSTK